MATTFQGYRLNAATVFQSLGWIVDKDFIASEVGATTTILWKSVSTIPTIAAIDAAASNAPAVLATATAQAEKAAATASVDHGQQQSGKQFDRLCVAVGQVALDAVNTERAAMDAMNSAVAAAASLADLKTRFAAITFPPQVTMAQLSNAIKSKIAATPE